MAAASAIDAAANPGWLVGLGTPLLGAAPFLMLLREKDQGLLSVEYVGEESETRRLALFCVQKNSVAAVKKLIDERLGLGTEHYRERDRRDEARLRPGLTGCVTIYVTNRPLHPVR